MLHTTRTCIPLAARVIRRPGRAIALVLLLLVLLVLAWPAPIDATYWEVPAPPARSGVLAANDALSQATFIGQGLLEQPEDMAFDAAGQLYTGTHGGTIWRVAFGAGGTPQFTRFAETGGSPLGLRFDAAGNLLVADSERGLLKIDPAGTLSVLLTAVDGKPLRFANDLDIGRDGTIYLSDTSDKFGNQGADPIRETLENRPRGRLIAYNPVTGAARVLLSGLYFANGVAVLPDQSAVLVAELARYRITRYWLSGPRAGTHDLFGDNLPGMPDGLLADDHGTVWVSFGALRNPLLDSMHRFPFLKQQMAKLPDPWLAATGNTGNGGLVLGFNPQGTLMTSLSEHGQRFSGGISNVVPYQGKLYLGTRYGTGQIGIYTLPPE